ncbi:polysaccharide deacetylase family protein [Actibacterium sp. 188UL27-1]|uniref:polysaccharide deacetylase family protein n=1 Tax=Actibacterium sp. 188UL27-1 TaxID=2786961 RepID=UPI001956493A|nr:polysaccharide deacetylase family protein [Actibacterium sp. 188UL27-1]MBM7068573.1 polysaccharide deacetylase family protein [Actibacterium sp. 188UL27-1]
MSFPKRPLSRRAMLASGLSAAAVSSAPWIARADTENRQIALTFDDAPRGDGPRFTGIARTQALIDGLNRSGATGAIFFVMTGNIAGQTDGAARLRAYTTAGHDLANHSHTHMWLRDSDPGAYLADIDRATEELAGFDRVLPFYRYPYLDEGDTRDKRLAVRTGLTARGLTNAYVTVDNYDWYMEALFAEAVGAGHVIDMDVLRQTYINVLMAEIAFHDQIACHAIGRSPRHVLLLHENDLAALFISDLVAALRQDGWAIIPGAAAYEDEIAQTVPDTQFNGQGRVAALAHAGGMAPSELVSLRSEEEYLRGLFTDRGLLPPV